MSVGRLLLPFQVVGVVIRDPTGERWLEDILALAHEDDLPLWTVLGTCPLLVILAPAGSSAGSGQVMVPST